MLAAALLLVAACGSGDPEPLPDVAASADATRPLAVGARLPDVGLRDVEGRPVRSRSLIDEGPVALVFYRGGW
jgi:hypothetical protein